VVHRTYQGLGPRENAIREFDALAPWAVQLFALQAECGIMDADFMALRVALDGLETAAYHFTRRRCFYDALKPRPDPHRKGNGRLRDPVEAREAFRALTPYASRLLALQTRCRPFGYDYCALEIARQGLETAAFHFTRVEGFYGLKGDASGRGGRPGS
jgi:hypothetical protein